jgi:hypothetical protein
MSKMHTEFVQNVHRYSSTLSTLSTPYVETNLLFLRILHSRLTEAYRQSYK